MSEVLREESASTVFDKNYWLSHCEGFEVRAAERRVGVVREVRFRSRLDRPDEIVVCGGLFGNREEVLAIGDVVEIVPREEFVVVASATEREPHGMPRWRLRRA